MNNKTIFIFRKVLFVLISLLLLIPQNTWAKNPKKIAIFPFDIHTEKERNYLQDQIYNGISTELMKTGHVQIIKKDAFLKTIRGKRVDEKLADREGREIGADFVIIGSLSRMGEFISIDVKVVNIKDKKVSQSFFVQGIGIESIGNLSAQLTEKIFLETSREQRIAEVIFTGNKRIEDSAVYNVLKSAKGKIFSERLLSSDIKAIYKMGYFGDVAVDVTDSPEGKVITFALEEKPLITDIEIKGNDVIETEEIEGVLTVRPRQILNLDSVKADAGKIKTLYDNKGYFNAEVSYTTEEEGDKNILVIFNIAENERLYIKSLIFEGNKAYSDKELIDMMDTSEWGIFHFLTDSGILKEDRLKQDINKLNVFYLNNGFINAKIGEPEITHDKEWVYVKIPVSEGKQFMVGAVEITGDTLSIPRAELIEKLKINKKDYYDRESVIKDIDYITMVCNNDGHAYADVNPRTMPREKDQKVDVIYNIKKGNQVYFNRISISGNTKTRDKVIRRQLAFVEGDLYSSSKLKTSYMKLGRLRYFEEIDFQTVKGPDENLTDINIHVKERPTGMFSIGAGYSAQDQAVFMAQVSQQNLFGRGQTLSLSTQLGSKTTHYELSFIEPWLFDIPLWSKFDLWDTEREYDSYDLSTQGFGTTFGYPLWEYVKGYLGYSLSTNDVRNVKVGASTWIKEQEGDITESSLTATLSRDTTDDYMFPTRGSKNRISTEYSGGLLQGDTDFTKYTGSSTWFFPLPLDTVFGVRGRAGFMHRNEDKKIPIYERFYLGGINSLRGLRDVGPTDPATGDVIGGETMACFNVEFIFPLVKNAGMKGVIFFDTGNAWEHGYHPGDMRETAGAGVRWYSPIGPLRLEWGHVLDRKAGEGASRWEFTIGMFM
ncbi:MAG: outer membrane protein assembly factor BamA [Thermodesulfobacteriota bacterium]|nr:outer membrane protein assembly factor BamA [Thermodesulfobacteriota bacterium]